MILSCATPMPRAHNSPINPQVSGCVMTWHWYHHHVEDITRYDHFSPWVLVRTGEENPIHRVNTGVSPLMGQGGYDAYQRAGVPLPGADGHWYRTLLPEFQRLQATSQRADEDWDHNTSAASGMVRCIAWSRRLILTAWPVVGLRCCCANRSRLLQPASREATNIPERDTQDDCGDHAPPIKHLKLKNLQVSLIIDTSSMNLVRLWSPLPLVNFSQVWLGQILR